MSQLLKHLKTEHTDYYAWLELYQIICIGFKVSEALKQQVITSLYTCKWNFFHFRPPSQKHVDFHESKAFVRVISGGNRSGKSCSCTCEMIMACLGSTRYTNYWAERVPVHARLIAPDFPNSVTKAIIPIIEQFLPDNSAVMKKNAQGHVNTLEFVNGSILEIMSYEQTVLKHASVKLHLVGFDEPPPKNIYNENMARLVDLQGRCIMGLTPIKEDGGYPIGWIYDDIYEKSTENPEQYFWMNVDIDDNRKSRGGYLPDVSVDRMIMEWSKDPVQLKARKEGRFTHLLGMVFKELDATTHLCDEFDVSGREWTRYAAIDPHPRNPMAYAAIAVNRSGEYYIYDEIYKNDLVKPLCETIKEHEDMYGDIKVRFMDESADVHNDLTGVNVLREFAKHGIHCRKASNRNKNPYGIPKVRELLHPMESNIEEGKLVPRLRVFKRCINTWYQMTHYIYDEYISARSREKSNPQEKPRKKDDHLVDCVLYIISNNARYFDAYRNVDPDDAGDEPFFSLTGY